MTTWRQRLSLSRLAIVRAGRSAGQAAHRVAEQGLERAKLTGAKLAKRVTAIQKAARLDPRLMRESARSVAYRPMDRASDRAWQIGYLREIAGRTDPPRRDPQPGPGGKPGPGAGPERPSPAWPWSPAVRSQGDRQPEAGG